MHIRIFKYIIDKYSNKKTNMEKNSNFISIIDTYSNFKIDYGYIFE